MKCITVTTDELERIAWAHPEAPIEIGNGLAVVRVGVYTYAAVLDEVPC